jgi:hypothetical protein
MQGQHWRRFGEDDGGQGGVQRMMDDEGQRIMDEGQQDSEL